MGTFGDFLKTRTYDTEYTGKLEAFQKFLACGECVLKVVFNR